MPALPHGPDGVKWDTMNSRDNQLFITQSTFNMNDPQSNAHLLCHLSIGIDLSMSRVGIVDTHGTPCLKCVPCVLLTFTMSSTEETRDEFPHLLK